MSVGILGLAESQFVAQAKHLDLTPAAAARGWRQLFREGTLPAALKGKVQLPSMPIVRREPDGATLKFAQQLEEGLETESVILPQRGRTGRIRTSLCVSSQVGCAMGCRFCETATLGRKKQLTPDEIVGQWFAARHSEQQTITNIVFMGMGEPTDNIEAVLQAIRVLTEHGGPAIAPSRISVSTVGRAQGIERLAEFANEPGFRQLRLAVSLNAPNDEVRQSIMPVNRAEPLADLRAAMDAWPAGDRLPILVEYVLIPGVNNAPGHAREVAEFLAGLSVNLNVIPYNPIRDSPWPAPTESEVIAFCEEARSAGLRTKRRRTMGRDAMAACGQLGNPKLKRERQRGSR